MIRASPLSADDRAILTERGQDLPKAADSNEAIRTGKPRHTFWAGLRKSRELTHDKRYASSSTTG